MDEYEIDLLSAANDPVEGSTVCSMLQILSCAKSCSVMKIQGENSLFICQLCTRKEARKIQRAGAHEKHVSQAESMLSTTAKRFKPASVGYNVAIPMST